MLKSNNVWIVVLASGFSRRMGEPKLLMPLHDGAPMIQHVARTLSLTSAKGVVLIYNKCLPAVQQAVNDYPFDFLSNKDAKRGMSTSLHLGIRHVQAKGGSAAIIVLGDQPGILTSSIEKMIHLSRKHPSKIIQANYQNQTSHPILFPSVFFTELQQTSGDKGARQLLKERKKDIHYASVNEVAPVDIDTKKEYKEYLFRKK